MPKREKHIIKRSLAEAGPDRTDHRRVRALTDEDIERVVASDPDGAERLFREALAVPVRQGLRWTWVPHEGLGQVFRRRGDLTRAIESFAL